MKSTKKEAYRVTALISGTIPGSRRLKDAFDSRNRIRKSFNPPIRHSTKSGAYVHRDEEVPLITVIGLARTRHVESLSGTGCSWGRIYEPRQEDERGLLMVSSKLYLGAQKSSYWRTITSLMHYYCGVQQKHFQGSFSDMIFIYYLNEKPVRCNLIMKRREGTSTRTLIIAADGKAFTLRPDIGRKMHLLQKSHCTSILYRVWRIELRRKKMEVPEEVQRLQVQRHRFIDHATLPFQERLDKRSTRSMF